jgi:flagellar basal body-associated protein FliL
MYDNGGMSSGMPTVSEVEKEEKSGKKITVILIIGVVIAILLAAGGFAAYKFLI